MLIFDRATHNSIPDPILACVWLQKPFKSGLLAGPLLITTHVSFAVIIPCHKEMREETMKRTHAIAPPRH